MSVNQGWRFEFKNLVLDLFAQSIIKQGSAEIALTQTEFKIIALFFKNPDKNLKREEIVKEVWKSEALSPKAFDFHLSKLREKLRPIDVQIHYQMNEGYRLQI